MKVCSVNNCGKPVKAKELCSMHHQRWRRHGDPTVTKIRKDGIPSTCQWIKCERPALSRGLCSKHYYITRILGTRL